MNKPTTLQDVARALQMHKSTVSLALSGKGTIAAQTRQRVFETARDMGYEPDPVAQRLAHGYNRSTVCLFSGVLDVGLTTEKILLVQRALAAHGLDVPIYTCGGAAEDTVVASAEETQIGGKSLTVPTASEEDDADRNSGAAQAAQVRQLCRQRPRAILCAAQRVHPAVFRELEAFQKSGGLVVSYDTPTPLGCDQVIFDREDNAYRATRFLLEQGHREIGVGMSRVPFAVGGDGGGGGSDDKISDPQHHRRRGFTRALREWGITPRPDWFFHNATYEKGGAEMARAFLAMRERPTAVAIVNDYVALAFMSEVLRAGVRIPHDLSVIGHDDQPIAAYCPVPLTCMTQPVDEIAQSVADLLLDRMQNRVSDEAAPRSVVIRSGFVERASVGPPPVSSAE